MERVNFEPFLAGPDTDATNCLDQSDNVEVVFDHHVVFAVRADNVARSGYAQRLDVTNHCILLKRYLHIAETTMCR